MTGVIALVGKPLGHSISPSIQQAALEHARLDIRYVKLEADPSRLDYEISTLRGSEWLGANVTVPYKESVVPLLDEVDHVAVRLGAVNTIVTRRGRLIGHNTDINGFEAALTNEAHFDARNCGALVLGAGGSARAIVMALARKGAHSITIANRTITRAESLISTLQRSAPEEIGPVSLRAIPLEAGRMQQALDYSQMIVNCTTVGMRYGADEGISPLAGLEIKGGSLVCDLVYNPLVTPLLKQSSEAGVATLGGLAMLVYQGALSFNLWTGFEAPIEVMFAAARKALKETGGGE
jgi:shikimate dehydrogenase